MATRPWYRSPVFYVLFVVVMTGLFVFHGPILHALQTWADRYFSHKNINDTLGWMSRDEAGILESLVRLVLGIVATLVFLVLVLFVWLVQWGWKLYLLVPVVGWLIARGLWVVAKSPVLRPKREGVEHIAPTDWPRRAGETDGAFPPSGAAGDSPASRRARIEAWLSSQDEKMP